MQLLGGILSKIWIGCLLSYFACEVQRKETQKEAHGHGLQAVRGEGDQAVLRRQGGLEPFQVEQVIASTERIQTNQCGVTN